MTAIVKWWSLLETRYLLMANQDQRNDPIGDQFYSPLRTAEGISDWMFYITACLSFATLLIDQKRQPHPYEISQAAFVIFVICLFSLGQATRLYFFPRAENKRRQDFLSNTLGTSLTHLRTSGYYNNNETDPIRRMGAAILENTHFTKSVALAMLKGVRFWTAVYVIFWLIAMMKRNTDLGWIAVAAQALFSEQLISRWLRIEWLRIKAEEVHNNLLMVFGSAPNMDSLRAYILEAFATYETTKTNAGIVMSSKFFKKMNPSLSAEWENIKNAAKIS